MPSAFDPPTPMEWIVLVRLGLATLAGALIGWNRHRAGKPAGISIELHEIEAHRFQCHRIL